jgi:hypothetical protein
MLRMFVEMRPGQSLSMEEAQKYDQRPFRSMLIQGWVSYKPGHGFHVTKEGRQAWREFENTEIWRKNPSLPLTAYFDPDAYKLKIVFRKKTAA